MKSYALLFLTVLCCTDWRVHTTNSAHYSYNSHYSYADRDEIHANLAKVNAVQTKVNSIQTSMSTVQTEIKKVSTRVNENWGNFTKTWRQLESNMTTNRQNEDITTKNIQTKIADLQSKVQTLEMRTKVEHALCESLPASTCGPCLCFDNYELSNKYYCDCRNLQPRRDCLAFYMDGVRVDGVYKITANNLKLIQVFCDQNTDGGGWTVFQRRRDGTVDFFRSWQEYVDGFGVLQSDFWLGNENLHFLTSQSLLPKGTELRIDMKVTSTGKRSFAKYSHFQVYNKLLNYMLIIFGYSGTSGDSLSLQNGKHFSTYDKDNDSSNNKHCARIHYGGWWYSDCGKSNLNGLLDNSMEGNITKKVFWTSLSNKSSLNFVEMKARRIR